MADIKVRVGAQNAIKVLSSASGGAALFADTATNVIGGIASVTQLDSSGISTIQSLRVSDTLHVTGLSTFVGVATFLSNQYVAGNVTIGGTLQVGDTIFGTDIDTRNLKSSGITTLASNGGITTTGGDLYVGGDLYIADDVVLDEVVLRNINVTGISTLGIASASTLNVVGISTFGTINATGVSTFSSPVSFGSSAIFGDNDRIILGDGEDLQIYHDSLNSYIADTGTGDLKLISAGNITLENSTLGTNSAVFDTTGGIDFYWGGAGSGKRLEIAGYGATITGDLYLSGDLFTSGTGKIGEDITTRNLDVTGISTLGGTLSVAGVTTFTSLVDADSGIDVTGHSELDTVYVSGLSTFVGDAKFDGNVSIAGTLTKEDVTNIDSVGIVTAGKGLRVTTGGIVVTAGISTFGAISTFTSNVFVDGTLTAAGIATFAQNVFVDGTLTAGLIDGGSY